MFHPDHTGLLTACEQDHDVSSWSCSQAVSKPVWRIPLQRVQWKTPDDGQRNCPKHVKFHSKNKFEKLVHLVGFIIRIYHDALSSERPKETGGTPVDRFQAYDNCGDKIQLSQDRLQSSLIMVQVTCFYRRNARSYSVVFYFLILRF